MRRESSLTFGSARLQFAELSGPRGLIQVYGLVMDAWWFDESRARQDAVRKLLTHVSEDQDKQAPLIACGDFNTDPDSDEIRMLTGRTTAPVPGLSFYDPGKWLARLPPATPGPTTIPGPPSFCGLTAGSITSSPPSSDGRAARTGSRWRRRTVQNPVRLQRGQPCPARTCFSDG